MIVPNKAISYENSLLSKLPHSLKDLSNQSLSVLDLYQKSKKDFNNVNQSLLAMDTLYLLKKIELVDGDIQLC